MEYLKFTSERGNEVLTQDTFADLSRDKKFVTSKYELRSVT